MADSSSEVLIGDANEKRFALLKEIIENNFHATVVGVDNFQSVKEKVRAQTWSIVLIAVDLPFASNTKSQASLKQIAYLPSERIGITVGLITSTLKLSEKKVKTNLKPSEEVKAKPPQIFVPLTEQITESHSKIIEELASLHCIQPKPFLPAIDWDKKDNPVLQAQIRALDDGRVQEAGEMVLRELIGGCLKRQAVVIKPLQSGKSGAAIFRVRHDEKKEFVLKLCDARNREGREKIEKEIEGYQEAQKHFPNEEYDAHIPKLRVPEPLEPRREAVTNAEEDLTNAPTRRFIVEKGHWQAIRYDFLGGKEFGEFIDLEKTLLLSAKELLRRTKGTPVEVEVLSQIANIPIELSLRESAQARATRLCVLDHILFWLSHNLYCHPTAKPVKRKLWELREDAHEKYAAKPPYGLSRKTKEAISNFLASSEAGLGERFFGEWKTVAGNVREFIENRLTPKKIDRKLLVVTSPVHGDLNANNVLFWLDTKRPFLIDFPFFHINGHALQDLAQLEVEIKFTLMDRQADSPRDTLKAYDYTHTQMEIWKDLEDHLLNEGYWQDLQSWSRPGYQDNVNTCLEMVQAIRNSAMSVKERFNSNLQSEDFFDEYFAALLYHTLRAIGYESLSVFKRLLAVYSAGKIIGRMSR